ncbi:MAG TPA: hypothetical protein VIN06_03295 [Devosia sp.]
MIFRNFVIPGPLIEIGLGKYSLTLKTPHQEVVVGCDIEINAPHLGLSESVDMDKVHDDNAPAASLLWHLAESEEIAFSGDALQLSATFPCGCTMRMAPSGGPEDVVFHSPPRAGAVVLDRWPADF